MPYSSATRGGATCFQCADVQRILGSSLWSRWEYVSVYCEGTSSNVKGASLASEGANPWVVGVDGRVRCCREGRWEDLGGILEAISVSSDGMEVWGIDDQHRVVRRTSGEWITLPISEKMQSISVAGDGLTVWCTDLHGRLCFYSTRDKTWDVTSMSGRLQQLVVSGGGDQICGVNHNKDVYFWWRDEGWSDILGEECYHISASENGCHVWSIGVENTIHYRVYRAGLWSEWLRVPGRLEKVHVSRDGSKVWGIDAEGGLWVLTCW